MSEIAVRLGEVTIAITLPHSLLEDGIISSLGADAAGTVSNDKIIITQAPDRSFAIAASGRDQESGITRGKIAERLLHALAGRFAELARVPVLRGAAVGWGDGAIFIAGPPACGKSSLAAWFIEKGFTLIGDDQVAVADGATTLAGYHGPLVFPAASVDHLAELVYVASAPMVRTPERIFVGLKESWQALEGSQRCGMMIFPRYEARSPGRVERVDAASAALRLKQLIWPGCTPAGDGTFWHVRMAQDVPAIALEFSHYDQIDGLLDRLARLAIDDRLSPAEFNRFISGIGQPPAALTRKYPVPERSTRQFERFMTIGMATYDDYDGVYFSLQAIRFYHPEILDDVEFLIIDNHPDGPCSKPLKDLEKHVDNLRYVPAVGVTGTAIRERVFSEASGEFVLCMDCHVLFAPGSLKKLVDYFRSVPFTNDLVQGPMIYDNLKRISTHWTEGWAGGMFGQWANDPAGDDQDNPPFAITFQGLGVFACRRSAWPGFNPLFRGFGGEEGYIHEKFRQAGGRVLCLPALRWLHRFGRPMGAHYPNRWEDRIRNYLIGFREIGWDVAEMQTHFRDLVGWQTANRVLLAARRELDGAQGSERAALTEDFKDDEFYDLTVARLQFVAEAAVPVLLENFAFDKATCMGRAADCWVREFSRHGIAAMALPIVGEGLSADLSAAADSGRGENSTTLACCFELTGVSSVAAAEKIVQQLTGMSATVVFAFAAGARDADINRLRASWTALFARRGYRPIDCLRPALAQDPRIDVHYQQNIVVFSSKPARKQRSSTGGMSHRSANGAETGVSVIVPVYNGAQYLSQAIESALLQTHLHLELIVVNDGSTDQTGAIAESYARVDNRVRVIHQENGGEAAAFNAGTAASRFALIARLDHDDIAVPERVALQVDFMEKNDGIAALGGALRPVDSKGDPLHDIVHYPLTPEGCHTMLVDGLGGPIGNPCAMIRKAALEQCGGLRTQFRASSDFDLWLRMDERFRMANLPHVLVNYRRHDGNISVRNLFLQTLSAHIARQAALLRRRGLSDPVDNWTSLGMAELSAICIAEGERSVIYRDLFNAAIANHASTNEAKYLNLADYCLDFVAV